MSVQSLYLRHHVDYFQTVVWLFCQRISKQIQLLHVLKFCQLNQKLVEITQSVVSEEQYFKEFELFETIDIRDLVVLAIDFFATEIRCDVIQICEFIFV